MGSQARKTPTPKEQLFVDAYLVTLNASDAYRKAGFKGKNANVEGHRILTKPYIQLTIENAIAERSKRTKIDQDWVVARLAGIVTADLNDLSKVVVGACRYCYGAGHRYQWRTEGEFETAVEVHRQLSVGKQQKNRVPVSTGGFGYSHREPPHPKCPMCDGYGDPRLVLGDTTQLRPEAKLLFAGTKQTQHGIEVKTEDKLKALELLARHVNFFKAEAQESGGALAEAIRDIQERTSKMPINRQASHDAKD